MEIIIADVSRSNYRLTHCQRECVVLRCVSRIKPFHPFCQKPRITFKRNAGLSSCGIRMFIRVFILYLFCLIVIALLWFVLGYVEFVKSNWLIVATFILIGIYSTFHFATSVMRDRISLAVIHWFFIIIFFFVVPLGQYVGDLFLFYIGESSIIAANLLILLWCIIFSTSYRYIYKMPKYERLLLNKFFLFGLYAKRYRLYVLTFVSALLTIYLISAAGGLEAFVTREAFEAFIGSKFGEWGPKALFTSYYLRPFIFWVFIFLLSVLVLNRRKPRLPYYFWLVLAFVSAIIINNLLSTARFYGFALLFGLLIILTDRKPTQNILYGVALFVGITLLPIANVFRYTYTIDISQISFKLTPMFFYTGDFDAYENFVHIIDYVNAQGLALGRQLFGALLFFIPRSVWPAKPIGSMSMVAQEYLITQFDIQNFNLTAPMIAEWFINFHILGVIFAAFIYGAFTALLDRRYQRSFIISPSYDQLTGRADFYRFLYPPFLGFFLFHLRGDFMSSYAYFVGSLSAFFSVYLVLKVNLRYDKMR